MDRLELLVEFILQSDKIERINDNRTLLEEQIRGNKPDGHVGAILFLEKLAENQDRFLTEEDIKKVQGLITAEQESKDPNLKLQSKHIGEYSDEDRAVHGRRCRTAVEIQVYMMSLAERVACLQKNWRTMTELAVIGEIAGFYFDFEIIHPFKDGNGRTGRAIVFYLMKFIGRTPFIFTEEEMYLHHFSSLGSGQREVMQKYFWDKSGLF
mgnify:CR=1 FL=1